MLCFLFLVCTTGFDLSSVFCQFFILCVLPLSWSCQGPPQQLDPTKSDRIRHLLDLGFCRTCRILSDSVGFCRTLSDFVGLCRILSDYWILSDLSDFVGFCWILSDFVRFCRTLADFVGLCRILSDFVGFCQTLSDFVGLCRTWSDLVGLCLDFSNYASSEYVGIFDARTHLSNIFMNKELRTDSNR